MRPATATMARGPAALERRALAGMTLAAVCFGAMAFLAKLASVRLGGAQVATVRFAIALLPFLLVPGLIRRALHYERLDVLFYRGFFGGTAVLCYFLAIEHIPIGAATLLNYASPIWSTLFAWLFLGERIRRVTLLPLAVALGGVALVVHANAKPGQWLGLGPYELAGIASSMLAGAALAAIRASRRTEGSWAILGSFTVFGLLTTAPFAVSGWVVPSPREWALLLACGLAALAAQLLMTHSYRWIDNVRAGAISQLAVAVAMSLGVLVLGEPLTPLGAVGSALTVTGVVATLALARSIPGSLQADDPAGAATAEPASPSATARSAGSSASSSSTTEA